MPYAIYVKKPGQKKYNRTITSRTKTTARKTAANIKRVNTKNYGSPGNVLIKKTSHWGK